MALVLGAKPERRPCIICGAALCSCKGANEPFVGRPLDLAAMIERPDGSYSPLLAKERILRAKEGQVGAYEVLYNVGDPIREADAIALGLIDPETGEVIRAKKPEGGDVKDKAEKGPKAPTDAGAKVPRDKAMRGPREKEK